MTGYKMLEEIARREYYRERERKNDELVDCMNTWAIVFIIIAGLLSIAGHVKELWDALASCF